MTWREAFQYWQQHGGHLPHWKTSQYMLNHSLQSAVTNLYDDKLDTLNIIYIGLMVKVSF